MKAMYLGKLVVVTIALTGLAGQGGIAAAVESPASEGRVARVIQVNASNSGTQNITIWIAGATTQCRARTVTTRLRMARTIATSAGNGATQSTTVWLPGSQPRFDVAPLK